MPAKKKKPSTSRAAAKKPAPAQPAPRILRLEGFITAFADSVKGEHDIRYCFVLGSGASITSDVPSGARLVDWWLTDLYRARRPDGKEEDCQRWAGQEFRKIPGFTWDKRHAFYGQIYNERFPDNANGQTYLRKLMERKSPSFGYSVLARILAQTRHNLVITTNFDNLVSDALVAQGTPRCFIAHSPEDAAFLPNHDNKPRIVKLHGDIDRETYNADSLIADLARKWKDALRLLLGVYTPVFIGYGGHDPGFMKFLTKEYCASSARPRPVWAYRVDADALKKQTAFAHDPPGRHESRYTATFMQKQQAWWLPTPGFDELMLLLGHALGHPHGGREIETTAERNKKAYDESLTAALKVTRLHEGGKWCPALDELAKQAEQGLLGEVKRRRWSEWCQYINAAVRAQEETARCEEAVRECGHDPRSHARLAWALVQQNPQHPRVEDLVGQATKLITEKYQPDDGESLESQTMIGFVMARQNHLNEAVAYQRQVLQTALAALSVEDDLVLALRNNLAIALRGQGKHEEAVAELRAVLAIRERVMGREHPATLSSRNNLAAALQEQGKHGEAEAEHRAVLAIRERVLGREHPDTLSSRNNLAHALQGHGKHREAETEHRAVLAIRERVMGPEHPDTLASWHNLAAALQGQSKHREAETENRAVLAIRERVLGPDHPDVFQSCFNLALCLEAQRKFGEAKIFVQRAYDGLKKVAGEDHPYTQDAKELLDLLQSSKP